MSTTPHRFAHRAMATDFEILVAGQEKDYAAEAAAAVFEEIDLVEKSLSKYLDTSDISRVNHLVSGESTRVNLHAFECLKVARKLCEDTGGAFDVTIGPLMRCWRNKEGKPRQPSDEELARAKASVGMDKFELDEGEGKVIVKNGGLNIDLGGIGKGYALDAAATVLTDWDCGSCLLSGGGSTVLALDAPPGEKGWSAGVGGVGDEPEPPYKVFLRKQALSGSGVYRQGRHIMDPHTGKPIGVKVAVWAMCPSGAVADALSTAFMVMKPEAVEAYCQAHPDTSAMLVLDASGGERPSYGPWPSREGV